MHRLQEVIRLHRLGQCSRRIARQMQLGRDTIRGYLKALSRAGVLDGPPDALPELSVLRGAVHEDDAASSAPDSARAISTVARWMDEIERQRARGAGPTAIHDHLRVNQPEYTGSLSAMKRMCARLGHDAGPQATDVAIPVATAPGEVAQVDFGYAGRPT